MAVILAFVFIAMYLPILLLFRVNDTAGNPEFYVQQLRQGDAYNFAYDQVLPAALDEAKLGDGTAGSIDLSQYRASIITIFQGALPRDYVQAQAEQAIRTVLPYILGDSGSFKLTIPLKDRVTAAAAAAKAELNKPAVFQTLYDQVLSQVLDNISASATAGPFSLSKADLESAIRTALPADWLMAQVDNIIDQMIPYLVKDTDHFAVRMDIAGRLDALEPVVVTNLQKVENYNSLISNIASTALGQSWQNGYTLPLGLQLTSADLKTVVGQVFSYSWYQGIVPQIVQPVFEYLKGTTGSLQVTIPLADLKPALSAAVAQLADQKLSDYVNSLPVATPQQLQQLLANPPVNTLPTVRPAGFTYDQIKQLFHIDIGAQVAGFVASSMPDQWVLTDSDLSNMLGVGGTELLASIRQQVINGYTFTEANLTSLLGADNSQRLDDIRSDIASGLVFTDQDLRNYIGDSNPDTLRSFDTARKDLGTARKYKMLLWLLPGLVLVGIGFLGGRRWGSRLAWAAGVLVVTAAIVLVAVGPVFSSAAQPQITEKLSTLGQQGSGVEALLSAKGATMAQNAIDAFIGGLRRQAIILLITSALLLMAGIVWYLEDMRRGRRT